jgi:hypothetical protein
MGIRLPEHTPDYPISCLRCFFYRVGDHKKKISFPHYPEKNTGNAKKISIFDTLFESMRSVLFRMHDGQETALVSGIVSIPAIFFLIYYPGPFSS